MASWSIPRPTPEEARAQTIEHLLDAAAGFRVLVRRWRALGDAERAAYCASHVVSTDELIEDLRRGSPKLLVMLAQEAVDHGDWETATRWKERAAQAGYDAAIVFDTAQGAQSVGRGSTPVLVVEDDPALRDLMVLVLTTEGYSVVAAVDGLEAVQRADEERPSLVILDLNLPYLEGDQVGARIRAHYGQALPIVLATANEHGAEVAEAIEAEYLPKPFDLDRFLETVKRNCEDAPHHGAVDG